MNTAEVKGVGPQKRRLTRVFQVMSASILVLTVAGCSAHEPYSEVMGYVVGDPSQRHPIRVSKQDRHTDFVVRRGDRGLNKSDKERFRTLIRRYKTNGVGQLFVRAPVGAPNEVAVGRALRQFRNVMKEEQIPRRAVHFATFVPQGDPEAPITVSYKGYVAKGPECGLWTRNLAESRQNLPYENFGCAQQQNLAAMVDNPKDLVVPRHMDPRDGERRDVLWSKYIKGEDTTSKKSKDQNAGISEAGESGGNKQ